METLKQVAPGVWFREGDLNAYGHCNNIVIEMKEYLVVVDANFPSGARAALADIRKVSQKPVKYVFDTHHHGDHAYGNPIWTQSGATTLAFRGVVDELKRREPERWLQTAKTRKDVGELNLPTAEPPREVIDGDRKVLDDGTRRIEFRHFGWAHTKGDGFVYLPREQILCTGDAVTNGPYNFMGDGNVANWPKVIAAAKKLKIKMVLPGHGVPGGMEVLDGEQRFMTEIRVAVEKAVQEGKTEAEIAKLQLPEAVKHWVGKPFQTQLKDVYQEVTNKTPRGDL